jgi:hypothetical protein
MAGEAAYNCFTLYNALKLHFETDKYCAIKFNFKTRVNSKSFFKRRDKYFFDKLHRRHGQDLCRFMVSNFIHDVSYVGDMLDDNAEKHYNGLVKRHESLSYVFKNDMSTLSCEYNSFDTLLVSQDGQHPAIVREYMQGNICLESVVLLNQLTNFMRRADKDITETIAWPELSRKIHKYSPFVKGDINKLREIILKQFTQ